MDAERKPYFWKARVLPAPDCSHPEQLSVMIPSRHTYSHIALFPRTFSTPSALHSQNIMASVEVNEKSRESEQKPQEKNEELKAPHGGGAGPVISKFFEDSWGWNSRIFPSLRFGKSNGARDQMETPVKGGGTAFSVGRQEPYKPIAVFCVLFFDKNISNFCLDKGIYRINRHSCNNKTPTSLRTCADLRSKWRSDGDTIRVWRENNSTSTFTPAMGVQRTRKSGAYLPQEAPVRVDGKKIFGLEAEHELFLVKKNGLMSSCTGRSLREKNGLN